MSAIDAAFQTVLETTRGANEGTLASYIPELARANPDGFGLSAASISGARYGAGDARKTFTIQSVSKPFVHALALCDLGVEALERHVGYEPSGEPFNAISLEAETGRPANPLINAGALVTTALVAADSPRQRFERIRRTLSAFAARDLDVDEAVYRSEAATGDRNRALAYLTHAAGALPGDAQAAAEVYFRQCAILVTAEDLAVMAATLAAGGVNPVSGARVVPEEVARVVVAVMATCGMYNASGAWMVRVGLPAKSGVGGGIAAVLPGSFGVAVYSPLLDGNGNSVRGIRVLRHLSAEFRLHMLATPQTPLSPLRRIKPEGNVFVVELRGDIDFVAAEHVLCRLEEAARDGELDGRQVLLDLRRVTRLRPVASRLLRTVETGIGGHSFEVKFVDPPDLMGD